MIRNLFLGLFVLCSLTVFSQDLLVTSTGDSINCKITKVKTDFIYFTFKHQEEVRSTLLPVLQVTDYRFDYFQQSDVPKEMLIGVKNYKQFRVAFSGGYSYMTSKVSDVVPSAFRDYVSDLKSGYHFGGDFTYYFSEPLGFGFKYFLFKSSNSIDHIYVSDIYGNTRYGKMSDDLTISFIGPAFSSRFSGKNKANAFIMNFALGYMGYRNNKVLIDSYKMTGGTMGMAYDLGYDIGLSKNMSLGFQLSLISGLLAQYKISDGHTTQTVKLEKEEYEGLSRIDLSVGLRFGK